MTTVGVISDTHGLLRTEALDALSGADHIIHAGDVGDPAILVRLRAIAPVTVVRGNVDHGELAALPSTEAITIADVRFYLLHDLDELEIDPAAAGIDLVVFGHSHRPLEERRDGVIYLNPGSIGPRRFRLPIAMSRVVIEAGRPAVEMFELACD